VLRFSAVLYARDDVGGVVSGLVKNVNEEALVGVFWAVHFIAFVFRLFGGGAQTRCDATRSKELPIYEIYKVGTTLHICDGTRLSDIL